MPNTQQAINDVCEYRDVPMFKKGTHCDIDGRSGQIVGGNSSANFNVKFDDNGSIRNCHPYWKMKIFASDGDVLYEHQDA